MSSEDKLEIFKVQRPVEFPPGKERLILIYNRDKSLRFHGHLPNEFIRELFPKNEYKVFRFGRAYGKGIELRGEAPWQDW